MEDNQTLRRLALDECKVLPPEKEGGDDRQKIANGPVYYLTAAQDVLRQQGIRFVTLNSIDDKNKLGMGEANLAPMVLALIKDFFKDSERCKTSKLCTGTEWLVDCDAYRIRWNPHHKKQWNDGIRYYVKFGFSDNSPKCLIVSIHGDETDE